MSSSFDLILAYEWLFVCVGGSNSISLPNFRVKRIQGKQELENRKKHFEVWTISG